MPKIPRALEQAMMQELLTGKTPTAGALLDRPLAQLCNKARLLEPIRHFILFDAGHKKVPRPHQYFGVKAAQERIARRETSG